MRRIYLLYLSLSVALFVACSGRSPVVSERNVLFRDDFVPGQTGNWLLEGDDVGRTVVLNDQLLIELHSPNVMQFATLTEPDFTDFVLEVDARQLGGSLESSFGVLVRMQDVDQFYRFEITGSGLYMIEKRNADGTWTRFIEDWTLTPAINPGPNVLNRLKVVAVGPTLSFYVNDILLQQISDASYVGGTIGLDAGTFTHGGLQVAFQSLVVRRP